MRFSETCGNVCPCCKEVVKSMIDNIIPDKATEKEIFNLKLKCINDKCSEILLFKELKDHIELCEYNEEKCEKCDEITLRNELDEHMKDKCKMALILCADCGTIMKRSEMEMVHKNLNNENLDDLCDKWSCKCPHKCQETLLINIKDHLMMCSKRPIRCKLYNIGCMQVILRENMNEHIKDNAINHSILMCQFLENTFIPMEKEMIKLSKENVEIKDSLTNLQLLNVNYQENIINLQQKSEELEKLTTHCTMEQSTNSKDKIASLNSPIITSNPFIWHIKDITQKVLAAKSDIEIQICSDYFYTSKPGYKMRMKIYPNGDGSAKNKYLSIFFVIVKGEYDDDIEWPFRSKVTITAFLNNIYINNSKLTLKPDNQVACYGKPTNSFNVGAGQPSYIALDQLINLNNYMMNDTLTIEMNVQH